MRSVSHRNVKVNHVKLSNMCNSFPLFPSLDLRRFLECTRVPPKRLWNAGGGGHAIFLHIHMDLVLEPKGQGEWKGNHGNQSPPELTSAVLTYAQKRSTVAERHTVNERAHKRLDFTH